MVSVQSCCISRYHSVSDGFGAIAAPQHVLLGPYSENLPSFIAVCRAQRKPREHLVFRIPGWNPVGTIASGSRCCQLLSNHLSEYELSKFLTPHVSRKLQTLSGVLCDIAPSQTAAAQTNYTSVAAVKGCCTKTAHVLYNGHSICTAFTAQIARRSLGYTVLLFRYAT